MSKKPSLTRAIFVVGASSSGKTTLCDALSKSLSIHHPLYIKEIARKVMRTHKYTRLDVDTYNMQHAIMSAQLEAESAAIIHATANTTGVNNRRQQLILSDRSAIDPVVYARTSESPGGQERYQRLLQNPDLGETLPWYREGLFIVLEPVEEWIEDDGVRSLEDPWKYTRALYATLSALKIPWKSIGVERKSLKERVEFVSELVEPAT